MLKARVFLPVKPLQNAVNVQVEKPLDPQSTQEKNTKQESRPFFLFYKLFQYPSRKL